MMRKSGSRCVFAAAVLMLAGGIAQAQDKPEYLGQGWSNNDRTFFYTTSQGSQLMPYDWFLVLERPCSNVLFRVDSLTRFGYLAFADRSNPDGLPLGFVKDSGETGDWLGMTCAACHTAQMKFAGKTLQIDGGPTDADMWAFISELGAALAETASSDAKFQAFADRLRGLSTTASARPDDLLRKDLQAFSDYFTKFVTSSKSDVVWGRARLDAFGMIFNRATGIDLDDWSNTHQPNAPVSYPFLWDTHWHDRVQWNGSAPNRLAIEQLGRNVGEVLGVFAKTDIKKTFLPPLFFKSTAKRVSQVLIEQKLATLRSPIWPQALAKIDAKKAAEGARLYQQHCVSCHAIVPRNKPLASLAVTVTPIAEVGTDPVMATNARDKLSKSGILEGVMMPFPVPPPIPAEGPSFELTGKIVIGAILAPPDWDTLPTGIDPAGKKLLSSIKTGQPLMGAPQAIISSLQSKIDASGDLRKSANDLLLKRATNTTSLSYKARPLDGIWATAPYLHNGSVPNLYQLLLPAKERMKKFYVGTREFDPVNVGFVTDQRDGAFELDTSLPGNSNTGHDTYGNDNLTDEQRWQLVEYLKTL